MCVKEGQQQKREKKNCDEGEKQKKRVIIDKRRAMCVNGINMKENLHIICQMDKTWGKRYKKPKHLLKAIHCWLTHSKVIFPPVGKII